ncbi:c-type cytochrome [Halalkalibaculum sp. DA3122]|uniref:c-type cytochrome n=1 Tax=unclassified Halalkalibaculum TaxID=2964617 RepID=UPI003754184F
MIKNILFGSVGFIATGIVIGIIYFSLVLPNVSEPPKLEIEYTDERVERGRYLVENVTVCTTCHTNRQHQIFSQPIDSSRIGGGNLAPFVEEGVGRLYAANITPYNLKNWTDGELYRAITAGVDRDGNALFPLMPYQHYAEMDREDIFSIIAYVRTLDPIEQEVPDSELEFPMNLIVKTIPRDPNPQPRPPKTDTIAYGRYLVNAASCSSCHTPKDAQGQPLPGLELAGGFEFPMPTGGVARSSNITPDTATGIGTWTEEKFVARFKSYVAGVRAVKEQQFNTEMPWTSFGGMHEDDLKAIYAYLRTVAPVEHKVTAFSSDIQ